MAEKSKFRELVSAALTLLTILVGLGGIIWLANACQRRPTKTVCPHCGREIKVNLEKNGEKKP